MAENPIRPTDDDARALARKLLRATRAASLGTLEDGHPSVSLTAMATAFDGSPVILVSRLSAHTSNLQADPRASLLVGQSGRGDPLAHPRMTMFLEARFVDREEAQDSGLRRRFLAHNPKAELYVDFPDFAFVSFHVLRASLNGGFGRAYELEPDDLLSEISDAAALREAEESPLKHMNAEHARAVSLYATRLCRMPEAAWRLSSFDPDGMVMQAGDLSSRLEFGCRVTTPGELRSVLRSLAEKARSIGSDAQD